MQNIKHRVEKITITIPHSLKQQLVDLKTEMQLSYSTIIKDALQLYLEQKEIDKWQNAAIIAAKDKDYLESIEEIAEDTVDFYK